MVDYWDRPGYCFPLVILYDRLGTTADGKTTYAQYLTGRFDFSHDMTADMPDEMVEALVGHELAHCWMYAVGDHPPTQYVESATRLPGRVLGLPGRPPSTSSAATAGGDGTASENTATQQMAKENSGGPSGTT